MDGEVARTLVVIESKSPDPADDAGDFVRPALAGGRSAESDERVSSGNPLPVPRPTSSECHLELHRRLEPVDVGTLEQTDLDQAHRSRRIATSPLDRLARWRPSRCPVAAYPRTSSTACGQPSMRACPHSLPTSNDWSTPTAGAIPRSASTRWVAGRERSSSDSARPSTTGTTTSSERP